MLFSDADVILLRNLCAVGVPRPIALRFVNAAFTHPRRLATKPAVSRGEALSAAQDLISIMSRHSELISQKAAVMSACELVYGTQWSSVYLGGYPRDFGVMPAGPGVVKICTREAGMPGDFSEGTTERLKQALIDRSARILIAKGLRPDPLTFRSLETTLHELRATSDATWMYEGLDGSRGDARVVAAEMSSQPTAT